MDSFESTKIGSGSNFRKQSSVYLTATPCFDCASVGPSWLLGYLAPGTDELTKT